MPRNSDVVQPKVRLRKELHRRLAEAARANQATLNGEIVRRLQESFIHELLDERLRLMESTQLLEKKIEQLEVLLELFKMGFERTFAPDVEINPKAAAAKINVSPRPPEELPVQHNNRGGQREGDPSAFSKERPPRLAMRPRGRRSSDHR